MLPMVHFIDTVAPYVESVTQSISSDLHNCLGRTQHQLGFVWNISEKLEACPALPQHDRHQLPAQLPGKPNCHW